ncbi:MAG: hypothetical protein E6K82_02815 [Candidatus Rokuibacteriota bacterium]|nr:MAG: hypothetical protein E6K82_02815 [Candidatus Rokubacteria bacterium]
MTGGDAMDAAAGLCAGCRHGRVIVSARGSTFWLCALGASDPRFPKYPRLPVVRCAGFTRRDDDEDDHRPSPPSR